jgi:hypothetical protein
LGAVILTIPNITNIINRIFYSLFLVNIFFISVPMVSKCTSLTSPISPTNQSFSLE